MRISAIVKVRMGRRRSWTALCLRVLRVLRRPVTAVEGPVSRRGSTGTAQGWWMRADRRRASQRSRGRSNQGASKVCWLCWRPVAVVLVGRGAYFSGTVRWRRRYICHRWVPRPTTTIGRSPRVRWRRPRRSWGSTRSTGSGRRRPSRWHPRRSVPSRPWRRRRSSTSNVLASGDEHLVLVR